MTGKNWRFWTNFAIFSPPIISPVMIKHAIIFRVRYIFMIEIVNKLFYSLRRFFSIMIYSEPLMGFVWLPILVTTGHQNQWPNKFEWRPTAKFKWRPYEVQIFYCLQKTKKKVATFFLVFLIGFLRPLELLYFRHRTLIWRPLQLFCPPSEAFCTPKFFSRRPNAKLRKIFTVFRYKNSKFGKNAAPVR